MPTTAASCAAARSQPPSVSPSPFCGASSSVARTDGSCVVDGRRQGRCRRSSRSRRSRPGSSAPPPNRMRRSPRGPLCTSANAHAATGRHPAAQAAGHCHWPAGATLPNTEFGPGSPPSSGYPPSSGRSASLGRRLCRSMRASFRHRRPLAEGRKGLSVCWKRGRCYRWPSCAEQLRATRRRGWIRILRVGGGAGATRMTYRLSGSTRRRIGPAVTMPWPVACHQASVKRDDLSSQPLCHRNPCRDSCCTR